ncbi:class I glutamine amidotransferase-like protein [Kalaharituber pfeilii]|nr:class I glutamine amidotransferase-like protein [Kalaharituber pfeilii]
MSTISQEPIPVGILLLNHHQYLDQSGPVDLMSILINGWPSLRDDGEPPLPKVPFELHYISPDCTLAPVKASSGPSLIPTHKLDDCPPLKVLVVPGPSPFYEISPELQKFLKEKFEECDHILSVCTGGIILARAGLLRGMNAASNKRVLRKIASNKEHLEMLRSCGVNWAKSGRWVQDGKVWTSAGVTAGMDMVSAWLSASPESGGLGVDKRLLEFVWSVCEWTPTDREDDDYAFLLQDVEL